MLSAPADPAAPTVPFREALRLWTTLGFISFGGPAGQIAIMHRELVEERQWVSEERFVHALQFCMLLPGPEAQQLATYIGWLLHRARGGLAAGILFVLPSIFILLGLSALYVTVGEVAPVAQVLDGFKAVVVGILLHALIRIGRSSIGSFWGMALAVATFVALQWLDVPYPLIVAAAAAVGYVTSRLARRVPGGRDPHGAGGVVEQAVEPSAPSPSPADVAAVSSDDSRSGRRAVGVFALAAGLWIVPLVALLLWLGARSLHVQEYLFFSQAALVTFGGAYAVLAYVTQAATERFGWITASQAVDGLAFAETTPGPLIMVLQFVGFLAAWNRPEGLDPWVSAILGALITTWVTFLPSIALVFLGAPFIEALRGSAVARACFGAVAAAVVGAMLHLAVVFGRTVLIRPDGTPDIIAAALAVAAFVALQRRWAGVVPVVLSGGLAGLIRWIPGAA